MTKRDQPALSIIELQGFSPAGGNFASETLQALEERINLVDPEIGSYLVHDFATAMSEAKKADVSLPLGGVPIAIKDLINVEGQQCTCASRILRGYCAPYSATVIEKLRSARRNSVWPDEHGRICHGFLDGKFERPSHA